jgi:osmotically-inducible protein OsmY
VEKEFIEQTAAARLRRAPYHGIRSISFQYHEGVLTLSGRVSSYYLKQVAQALVFPMDGVHQLNNRLHVAESP